MNQKFRVFRSSKQKRKPFFHYYSINNDTKKSKSSKHQKIDNNKKDCEQEFVILILGRYIYDHDNLIPLSSEFEKANYIKYGIVIKNYLKNRVSYSEIFAESNKNIIKIIKTHKDNFELYSILEKRDSFWLFMKQIVNSNTNHFNLVVINVKLKQNMIEAHVKWGDKMYDKIYVDYMGNKNEHPKKLMEIFKYTFQNNWFFSFSESGKLEEIQEIFYPIIKQYEEHISFPLKKSNIGLVNYNNELEKIYISKIKKLQK